MNENDDNLVRNAQAGDQAAFEELVRRTARLIFARLYLETGDPHQAEDLAQETILIAYQSLPQLTEPSRFRPWLLRIAQNVAIDSARRQSRQKRTPPTTPPTPRPILRPEEHLEREETRQQVLAILRSLPEEYRLPLTLRFLAGADYASIQLQMGLTNGSLRGLLHRGLKMLRTELEKGASDLLPHPSISPRENHG